ncbi:MAG: hypothetical protein EXR72_25300, partial [Myxococcales bacterium]|nr:hypothetical protein [Myxococcales bacterium]
MLSSAAMPTEASPARLTPAPATFASPYAGAREHLGELLGKVQRWLERHRLLFPDRHASDENRARPDTLTALDTELRALSDHIASREQASRRANVLLPLDQLRRSLSLSPIEVDLLVALAAAECEPDFHRAYMRAWGDASVKQGDVAFFCELVGGRGDDRFALEQALQPASVLCRHGLVTLAPDRSWVPRAPLLYLRVKLGARLGSYLQGEIAPSPRLLPACLTLQPATRGLGELVLPATVGDRVAGALAAARQEDGTFDPICLIAPRHSGRKALCAALLPEAPMVVLRAGALPKDPELFEQLVRDALCE